MMLVTPEGLGKHAKGRVVSGRAYQNFVQMLRLADARESLLDTFHTECATGLRVQLFGMMMARPNWATRSRT